MGRSRPAGSSTVRDRDIAMEGPSPPNVREHLSLHQTGHNIEWQRVLALLTATGSTVEQRKGKLRVTIGYAAEVIVRPTGKDIDQQMIVVLRRIFRNAGIAPDNPARNTHNFGRSADARAQADGDHRPRHRRRAIHENERHTREAPVSSADESAENARHRRAGARFAVARALQTWPAARARRRRGVPAGSEARTSFIDVQAPACH
jgi:hypothetical protein